MEYQNSSKTINNLALFYKSIDEQIFKESRFVELMNILLKNNNLCKINYAFYTDSFLLKTNIYIPNFHTMYLGTGNHNVIIENHDDVWLSTIFTNNNYYVVRDPSDNFNYENHGVKIINKIQDILCNIPN